MPMKGATVLHHSPFHGPAWDTMDNEFIHNTVWFRSGEGRWASSTPRRSLDSRRRSIADARRFNTPRFRPRPWDRRL
ncbi:hypothetical protein JXA47_12535 [Candidatus Sumerlaeota bacterium]|nr:hypothetical protein [Candidatus Sumerlaeota bacterium]